MEPVDAYFARDKIGWEEVVKARLATAGHSSPDDQLIVAVARGLAEEMIDRIVAAEHNRYQAERARLDELRMELSVRMQLITDMVRPLIAELELGPFDEIVSVAIRDAGGDVRVVNLKGTK